MFLEFLFLMELLKKLDNYVIENNELGKRSIFFWKKCKTLKTK